MTQAFNIDCMEYMRSLPDNAFDIAVVDVPYGINQGGEIDKYYFDKQEERFASHSAQTSLFSENFDEQLTL